MYSTYRCTHPRLGHDKFNGAWHKNARLFAELESVVLLLNEIFHYLNVPDHVSSRGRNAKMIFFGDFFRNLSAAHIS